jgi:O-antigen/teichoic acid export membrane protein
VDAVPSRATAWRLGALIANARTAYAHIIGQGTAVLVRNSAATILGVALRFIVGAVLARSLGVTEFGRYAGILAYVEVVRSLALLGLQVPITRFVALYKANSDWPLIRGLMARGAQFMFLSSLMFAAAFVALASSILNVDRGAMTLASICLAASLIPLRNLETLRTAALAGLDRVALSRLPDAVVRPIIVVAGIGAYVALVGNALGAETAIELQALASVGGLFIGSWWMWRTLPPRARSAPPRFAVQEWIRGAMPFALLGILQPISAQIDILCMTLLTSADEVGRFRAASVLASGLSLPAAIVIPVLFPKFVRYAAASDREALQRLSRRAIQGALLITLPAVVVVMALAGPVLVLLFGSGFAAGAPALMVLALAQLLMTPLLYPSQLLAAGGYAAVITKAMPFAIALGALLSVVLIPPLGALGAALASLATQVGLNGYIAYVCHRRLSVNCLSLLAS